LAKDPADGYHKDHVDYDKRVVPLRRWHPDRPVGESTGNVVDSRADESLYKPSTLGRAWCSIREVRAGEDKPFTLTYEAGNHELQTGTIVKFWMVGQGSLGTAPQLDDPGRCGFVQAHAPDGVELELLCDKVRVISILDGENPDRPPQPDDMIVGPITIGFRIKNGTLSQGDTVRLQVGAGAGFPWKKLAGRKEFKVIIDEGPDVPKKRLPEPVVIKILPLEPAALEILVNATRRPGEKIHGTMTYRDKYDNRVRLNSALELRAGDQTFTGYVSEGRGVFKVEVTADAPVQITGTCAATGLTAASNWCIPVAADAPALYFGDMHTHDFNSTAEAWTSDTYLWARDDKRLDFVSVPIQMHRYLDNEKWHLAKHMNEYFLDEGRFVTFLAFEWQHSHYGDKVVHYLGGDAPYLPVNDPRYDHPAALYQALRGTDAFIISHHPGYELDLHVPGTDWDAVENDVDRLVELWSMHGSSEGFDPDDRPLIPPRRVGGVYDGLRKGLRYGLVGGSDTHTGRPAGSADDVRPYWGGYCAIWAAGKTRRDLFAAFMARRTYALTGARIVLQFTVNGEPMGAEIPAAKKCDISVRVWAPGYVARIQILRDLEILREFTPGTRVCTVEFADERAADDPTMYHCRVVQDDGHLAVCTPVWVG